MILIIQLELKVIVTWITWFSTPKSPNSDTVLGHVLAATDEIRCPRIFFTSIRATCCMINMKSVIRQSLIRLCYLITFKKTSANHRIAIHSGVTINLFACFIRYDWDIYLQWDVGRGAAKLKNIQIHSII